MGHIVAIVVVFHVIHRAAISFLEALAELAARALVDGRVLIHLVVIGIGVAMLAVVVACSLDAFVESALLCITIFRRWLVPATVVVLILCRAGERLCFVC